jgi:hypothetical protein
MTTYDNCNRGVLFSERGKKATDTDRDYSGTLDVEGVAYWVSAWIKTSKKGTKFLSLSLRRKDEKTTGGGSPKRDDSEIPF